MHKLSLLIVALTHDDVVRWEVIYGDVPVPGIHQPGGCGWLEVLYIDSEYLVSADNVAEIDASVVSPLPLMEVVPLCWSFLHSYHTCLLVFLAF